MRNVVRMNFANFLKRGRVIDLSREIKKKEIIMRKVIEKFG